MSLNVLITAASRRVALVRAFRRALHEVGTNGIVVVTDVNPLSPAMREADRAHRVPLSTSPTYLDRIAELCQRDRIGLLVPTIDDELTLFGRAAATFAHMGTQVAVSPPRTSQICGDKFETCRHLAAHGVAAARSYLPRTLPPSPPLPLFVKPRTGRGGVAAFPAHTARELDFFMAYVPDPVVQTYLDGPEFTIDLLCDFAGRPLAAVPRERVVIRAGVIDRGRTVRSRPLLDLTLACADVLPFVGAVNIQCRIVDGRPVIFEINPRFSGGIALTTAAGADFPRMLIELALGRGVQPVIGRYQADLWMSNFESSVFFATGAGAVSDAPAEEPHMQEVA